jgi:AcrR family transcriptional regulator
VKTRAYDSPLRTEQAERTREKILEALAEQLNEGDEDFSIPRVAQRAGVSTRTVYHHFPNRESQVEALATWIERKLGPVEEATTAAELPAYAERCYRRFVQNEPLVRAQLAAGVASSVRSRRRRRREQTIEGLVRGTARSDTDGALAAALIKHLISADAGVPLLDKYGLDVEQSAKAARWAVRVLLDALARGDGPAADPPKG